MSWVPEMSPINRISRFKETGTTIEPSNRETTTISIDTTPSIRVQEEQETEVGEVHHLDTRVDHQEDHPLGVREEEEEEGQHPTIKHTIPTRFNLDIQQEEEVEAGEDSNHMVSCNNNSIRLPISNREEDGSSNNNGLNSNQDQEEGEDMQDLKEEEINPITRQDIIPMDSSNITEEQVAVQDPTGDDENRYRNSWHHESLRPIDISIADKHLLLCTEEPFPMHADLHTSIEEPSEALVFIVIGNCSSYRFP